MKLKAIKSLQPYQRGLLHMLTSSRRRDERTKEGNDGVFSGDMDKKKEQEE